MLLHVILFGLLVAQASLATLAPQSKSTTNSKVLVLDVDGTLYNANAGIEQQIVKNIHRFVKSKYGLSEEECDNLHHKYGSTIQGLQVEGKIKGEKDLEMFYQEVYADLDYTGIYYLQENTGDATGYSHSLGWKNLLKALPHPKYIASNSPRPHIERVLKSLGLADMKFLGIITPDITSKYLTKTEQEYWKPIFEKHAVDSEQIVLLDDSVTNLKAARSFGVEGLQITDDSSMEQALCSFAGAIPKPTEWQFDALKYLKSKNVEDNRAMSKRVWERVLHEISENLPEKDNTPLVVYDLGAGLLNMLQKFLDASTSTIKKDIHYIAFETEDICMKHNVKWLTDVGFQVLTEEKNIFEKVHQGQLIRVSLKKEDFTQAKLPEHKPHVIIGCCLADLFDPEVFASSVLRIAQGVPALVYLPITFAGQTNFAPSLPQQSKVPSDIKAMEFYHESLEKDHGHNLVSTSLMDAFKSVGAAAISQESSNWRVDQKENSDLWRSLLYFFGLNTAFRLYKHGYDAGEWIERVKATSPTFDISNVDFLFKLEAADKAFEAPESLSMQTEDTQCNVKEGRYLEFIGPKQVQIGTEEVQISDLGPNDVLIQTKCSMISTGTELKIFKGEFDSHSAVDTVFSADEEMGYPLRYGYSLVGEVIACGDEVKNPESLVGRLVFTFASHQSLVVASSDSIMMVPEGIDAEDAVYLPAVETALSLVQDANPRVGENVAIVGQGLIGLLVTAILGKVHGSIGGGKVIAIDMIPERLAVARRLGATDISTPMNFAESFESVDTSIEVSGNMKGLQFAVDNTAFGGTVLIGSWYGNTPGSLTLGLDFHRSHLTIRSSQVSDIPAQLTDRWTKERRFETAWKLVSLIHPSQYVTTSICDVASAQTAYESLEKGEQLGVQFTYNCDQAK